MLAWQSSARSYSRRIPVTFAKGAGSFLFDAGGTPYLDFLTGAGASILGHAHPAVMHAIKTYDAGFLSHLDLITPLEAQFAEQLLPILPFADRAAVCLHFCGPSGSDAVEAALKLARTVTGRDGVWAFSGAYHGDTQGALSVSSNNRLRALGLHGARDVTFFPFPLPVPSLRPHRFGAADAAMELTELLLEQALADDHSGIAKPAAIIIEPVQGEGGVCVAPRTFMTFLRRFCTEHDIVLICDEIQSGLGRTGAWFASQHSRIEPDIICVSKGVGGGLPIAFIAYPRRFNTWPPGAHIGTFRGASLSLACATAVVKFARDSDLPANVRSVGAHLRGRLEALQARLPDVTEIRGLGLFLGVQFRPDVPDLSNRLGRLLIENRIVAEFVGRNSATLKLLPPLTLSFAEADDFCDRFERAVARLSEKEAHPEPVSA